MQNSYTVINASAGSGKTYQLVQRLLMICLRNPNQHTNIRNILALTFTNKAANEMKERILKWLGDFAAEDYQYNQDLINLQEELKKEGIKVTLPDLHLRSKKLLDYVLHNYSTLNIGTIDRFNARLVRSFSHELGLAKNFNLEIQAEPYLIEAVDQMLDQIGENDEISSAYIDYVNYGLDNEKRVNLNKTLYDSAKEFVNDIHYEQLKSNSSFTTEHYKNATKKIREEIKNLEQKSVNIAQQAVEKIKEKGLENSDFFGGGNKSLQYFFDSYLINKVPKLYDTTSEEENKIANYRKGASKAGKSKEHIIDEIIDELLLKRMQIIQNFISIQKKQKILSALLPLKVNKDIQDGLAKIEEEKDLVLLSKFNILINENLRNEPSQFIYEKVGSQFHHYFFDEFQDTSVLQWQNFIPLRDHSISLDGTSFTLVGDPKQSIYRFRGGESQLMLDIISKQEVSARAAEVKILHENWRSAKNIVQFNNELYEFISNGLNEEHRNIFGKDAAQKVKSSIQGRLKVNLIPHSTKEDFYNDSAEKMQKNIQECVDRGFKFSDIAILCRGNRDIFHYSQKLGMLNVNYNQHNVGIKTISESGLTLELSDTLKAVIHLLKWETNIKNLQHLTLMMYYLNKLGRINMEDFTCEMQQIMQLQSHTKKVKFIIEKYGLNIQQENFPRLNLYNYIEYLIQEFSVENKETDFLLNFLETLYAFTQNAGATVKDFIKFWEEEAHKKTIQASENVDAIKIMTIHKAKGLEFPVVLLPMENKNFDREFKEWFLTDDNEGLSSVNMNQFTKSLEIYDDEILNFNSKNAYRNTIDRLCIQYVATTRPVEELYLYIQRPSTDKKTGTENTGALEIYNFIKQKNGNSLDEFDLFEFSEKTTKQSRDKKNNVQTQSIKSIKQIGERSSAIKIATPSRNYQTTNENVRRGIFTHEILAKINSEKDINFVLDGYLLEGLITSEEKEEIQKYVLSIVRKYPNYFDEHLKIINEQEIMITEKGISSIYRPDRLVKKDDSYIVIDFKTGVENEKHRKQIYLYKNTLEKLGKKVLHTDVIYI